MSFLVRRATVDDWRELRDIRLTALATSPTAFSSTLQRETQFSEETWRRRVEDHAVFLALKGDEVVGTATCLDDPSTTPGLVSLMAMYVAPPARGTGCAFQLIDAVVQAATASGATQLSLHVTDVNVAAQRCYRRYGFTETGARRPLPDRPEIAEVEMVLELAGATAAR